MNRRIKFAEMLVAHKMLWSAAMLVMLGALIAFGLTNGAFVALGASVTAALGPFLTTLDSMIKGH